MGDAAAHDALASAAVVGLAVTLSSAAAAAGARLRRCRCSGCRPRAAAAWVRAKFRGKNVEEAEDLSHRIAKREIQSLCVQRARITAMFVQIGISFKVAAAVAPRFAAKSRGPMDEALLMTTWACVLGYALTLAAGRLLRTANARTLHVFFCLASLLMVPFQLAAATPSQIAAFGRFSAVWCVACASWCNKTSLVLLANLSLSLLRLSVYSKVVPAGTGPSLFFLPLQLVSGEFVCSLLIAALAHSFHSMSFELVHQKILVNAVRQESGAMMRLLDLMTDVVVEVDADLRILHPSPKLAAMLTLGTSLSVEGMRLQDFMPSASDQERFETLAYGLLRDDSEALPSVMHATLRGPFNSLMQVDILYAVFPGIDGAKRLLAGVREVTDSPTLEATGQGQAELLQGERGQRDRGWSDRGQSDRGQGQAQAPCGDRSPASSLRSSTSSRRRRTSGRGTPPASLRRSLGAVGQSALWDPRYLETSRMGRELSMLSSMSLWNCKVSDASCCAFHSYLGEAVACCSELSLRRCTWHFPPLARAGQAQCQACGILAEWLEDDLDSDADAASHPAFECDVCLSKSVRRPSEPSRMTL